MDGFLSWFYDFFTTMLDGLWKIVSGLFNGVVQVFNIPAYYKQFTAYSANFTAVDWVVSILAFLLVFAVWGILIFLLVLGIRKYIRFRRTVVGNEDLLEELADLHRDVVRLTTEKEKIMAMKVGQTAGSEMGGAVGEIMRTQPEYPELSAAGAPALFGEGGDLLPEEENKSAQADNANDQSSKRFFRLAAVDDKYEHYEAPAYRTDLNLEQLCDEFRNFACTSMHLYYEQRTIRLMFAGMASTKLILLQGISGTGKTSLPYAMGKFFQDDATIASVQPSWRDRTELFGYFNEFTKKFNETEVLRRLYEASYNDDMNLIVLDEMNIARVEYYFAEMLSVLEMPDPAEWKLELVPSAWPSDPKHLADGKLFIPQNVWYVGTANNDDSTFAVSDKVYDRALVINLDSKGIPFEAPMTGPSEIAYSHVAKLFAKAIADHPVNESYLKAIGDLDLYVISKFRIAFGNRIIKQLNLFVPVYVACGGKELDGVDYILATKVFRKFESLNLSLIRDEIDGLIEYLRDVFGRDEMGESIAYLERLKKMY